MRFFPWFRGGSGINSKHHAAAEQRMQRVMQGFQQELEGLTEPAEPALPGEMPEILSRGPAPSFNAGPDGPRYPWQREAEAEPDEEPRRRRY